MFRLMLLWLILGCGEHSMAKRVVFFPFVQTSHVNSFVRVAKALQQHNHKVWVCLPYFTYNKGISNMTNIHVITYGKDGEDIEKDVFTKSEIVSGFWAGLDGTSTLANPKIPILTKELMHRILTDKVFIESLEKVKPEYFVLDSMPLWPSSLLLPYKFNVPFSTLGVHYDIIGTRVPFSPVAVPNMLSSESFTTKPTFFQRLQKTAFYFILLVSNPFWHPEITETLVPRLPPPSSLRSILQKADLFLIENDVILGYPLPMLANTVMIGGTSAVPAKPLPEKFERVVQNSPQGIAVVSFGSSVDSFPPHIVTKLANAFQTLPFHVVWRLDMESPDHRKLTTSTWLPQNDLLGHNDGNTTRIFVSHCGGWGQYEALYHGVPTLCLPIFADQFFNAQRVHDKGFGTFADIRSISTEALAGLCNEVANNETYRQNIKKASKLYKELYKNAAGTAAYWLDHVMKHGASHLRAIGQDMPLYQLLLLDVLVITVSCISALLCSVYFLARCCWSRFRQRHTSVQKKKKHA